MHLQLSSLLKLSVIHLFIYLRSGVFFKGKIKRESRLTGKEQKKKKKEEKGPPDRRLKNLTDRRLNRSSTVDEAGPT